MANLYKYTGYVEQAFAGGVNWTGDTIKVALVSDTYVPDQDVHEFWSSVVANEVSGTGYTAGGITLVTKTIAFNPTNHSIVLSAANVSWPVSTITARYVVIYKDTGVAATSVLCGFADLGENKSSSNGDFNLNWSASGIFEILVQQSV